MKDETVTCILEHVLCQAYIRKRIYNGAVALFFPLQTATKVWTVCVGPGNEASVVAHACYGIR